MAFGWKPTFTYLQYAQVCARTVRASLKEEVKVVALRREEQALKYAKWEAGKQGELKNTLNAKVVA